jgi:hypothetical protein
MRTQIISTLAAAAVALAGLGATPARADDDDIARIIAGLMGIAILGAALNDRDDRRPVVTPPRPPVYPPERRECLRKRWTPNGWVSYYAQNCVAGYNPRPVPQPPVCQRRVWTSHGWQWIADRGCNGRGR